MAHDIDRMVTERKRLLKQKAIIEERLSIIEGILALNKKLENAPAVYFGDNFSEFSIVGRGRKRPRGVLPPSEIVTNVRELLIEAGRPMNRRELLKELERRNIPVIGKDRAKVVGTIVWRAKEPDGSPSFINTEKGYWPSDIPLPSVQSTQTTGNKNE